MRHGYTVVWCGWQHDVPEADGLMRIKVPEAQIDGRPVSGRLLVGFQPSKPFQVQLLSDRGHRPYPSRLSAKDGDPLTTNASATIWTTRMLCCWCATATQRGHERSPAKGGHSPGWRRGALSPTRTTFISPPASSPAE